MHARRLLCILLIVLFFAPAVSVGQTIQAPDKTSLQIESFEKAYYELRDNWIFFQGHKKILSKVIDSLSEFFTSWNVSAPILGEDEKTNVQAVKIYIGALIAKNPRRAEELIRLAINQMIRSDMFSRLETPKEFEEAMLDRVGTYVGDGADYNFQDNKLQIISVRPQSPASLAGLGVGDIILRINNVDFSDVLTFEECESRFKQFLPQEFEVGQEITYRIMRGTQELVFKTHIIEEGVKSFVSSQQDGEIAIITIDSFGEGCGKQFLAELKKLIQQNVRALIINLKDNLGGYVSESLIVIKALTGKGFKNEMTGGREMIWDNNDLSVKKIEYIAVLTNGWTASAAETTAACLQESGAMVFGKQTFGKHFGQTVYLLPNGDYLWYSNHWIKTLNGKSWPDGIEPNFFIEDDEKALAKAKEFLLQKLHASPPVSGENSVQQGQNYRFKNFYYLTD